MSGCVIFEAHLQLRRLTTVGRCGALGMTLDLTDDEKAALVELLRGRPDARRAGYD
jgi:hypothetical protein